MKKIFALITSAVLLSFPCFTQQYYNPVTTIYTRSSVILDRSSKIQMDIIGNPVRNTITLQVSNPTETKYELSLYSSTGRKVTTMLYDHPAGVSIKTIYVSEFQRGMYFLVVLSKTESRCLQVVLQ